MNNGINYKV